MSDKTGIEWADASWNCISGCTRASAGCDNCYAVRQTYRLEKMGQVAKYGGLTVLNGKGDRHFNGVVRCHEEALTIPIGWKRPRRIFVNSMSDLFHKEVPFEFIDKVFAVMNATSTQLPLPADLSQAKDWHVYQILTKRPDRMAEYLRSRDPVNWPKSGTHPIFDAGRGDGGPLRGRRDGGHLMNAGAVLCWPLPNVWIGTSCENQDAANLRVPFLARCPGAVRFISYEPALGPIDFSKVPDEWDRPSGHGAASLLGDIDWLICGGESGPGARPFDIAWARDVRDQCRAAGTAFFQKQLGSYVVWDGIQGGYMDGPSNVWPLETGSLADKEHGFRKHLVDKKGGEMSEWPEDLRVREMPRSKP